MERIKQKMEDARDQRDKMQHINSQTTDGLSDNKSKSVLSRNINLLTLHENRFWFLSGMTVVIAAVIIAWRIMSAEGPENNPRSDPVKIAAYQAGGSAELPVLATETDKLREDIDYLYERLKMLSDSATYLERKLIRAHVITDSIISTENKPASSPRQKLSRIPDTILDVEKLPPPAAGITDTATALDKITHEPASTATSKSVATARKAELNTVKDTSTREPIRVAAKQPAAIARNKHGSEEQHPAESLKTGAWVINLVSLPSQADADQFSARARSKGMHTEQQKVTVKGKKYWRVQITGFATSEEAKSHANLAKQNLGLKDVWITKR